MERKQSEADLANMLNRLSAQHNNAIWVHKWADMRVCPNCHQLLYKVEDNVDYTIIVGDRAGLVECKQDEQRFSFADEKGGIRPKQRQWLNEWVMLQRYSWLFLEMGDGHAPKDRNAYLVPWHYWLHYESKLEEAGKKSLAWRPTRQSGLYNAEDLLCLYKMKWEPNAGFVIPKGHIFYDVYAKQIKFI